MTVTVTNANFDAEVVNSDKPVLIDFWATWCPPCKMMAPVIDQIENEHPEYKICKVDVDAEPELAARFGIMSIPTFIAFKNGKQAGQSLGVQPKNKVLDLLK